jgi:hypothetical protein
MSAHDELLAWDRGFYAEILTAQHLAPIRHLYEAPPESLKEHKDFFWLHNRAMWAMVRNLSQKAVDITIEGIDDFVRNRLKVSAAGLSEGGNVDSTAHELTAKGYAALPPIDEKKLTAIQAYFETQECYPGRYNPNPELYSLEEARKEQPYIAHYPLSTVMGCPNLMAIANHPVLISTVAKFLGTIPTILDYSVWWSFSHRESPKEAQLFHYDLADYRFCTLMMYLTDVNDGSGPHILIEGSHDLNTLKGIQQTSNNKDDKFNDWYFYHHHKMDEDVHRYFDADPVSLTGTAGTNYLLVPRTIHKGVMPTETDRLVCQVTYCCTPQLQTDLRPLTWGSAQTEKLPKWLKAEPFRYINRLFLETE